MKEYLQEFFRKYKTYIFVLLGFVLMSIIFFHPVLSGMELSQGDNINAEGMAHEVTQYEQQTGESSAWTNSMFGGMPAYNIKSPETFNIHLYLQRFLHLGLPYSTMAIFFVYLLGFYVLLISLKFNQGISIVGAVAFALSSYNIIIIAAGHITKCYAIAYMAPVIAGMIFIYSRKYLPGFFLMAFALGMEIACNHTQILYYLAIMCGVYFVYSLIMSYRERKENPEWLKVFGKATGIVAIACVFAVLPNITNLWTTWEYSKFSTRSQSELSTKQGSTGLDKDYALGWSYGVRESFNLMVPDFKGGASEAIGNDPAVSKIDNSQIREAVQNSSRYWGDQPFTSGPVYIGAILVFLFVLGMFILNNPAKWWLFAATVISLIMSWGYNSELTTDFLFNYFPMYNKFRSVSMALVIAQVAIPFLAMMTLKKIYDEPEVIQQKAKGFYISLGLTAGLCLLFVIFPSLSGSFLSENETAQFSQIVAQHPEAASSYSMFETGLENVRKAILRSDLWRSIIFICLAAAVIYIGGLAKMKAKAMVIALGLLIAFDLWTVDVRYLNSKNYKYGTESNPFKASMADQFILKDNDPDFRVLNLSRNVFNDGITPYFHKSIGGYHGAKMRRYQEFIDTLLAPTINAAINIAQQKPEQFQSFITNSNAINMLNTKFIIMNPAQMPIINMNTFGNAWFVNKFDVVDNADKEIGALRRDDLRQTAIINKSIFADYMQQLPSEQIYASDSSVVSLAEYKPNYIKYNALAYQPRLCVFSEIYYPKGWTAYIDGSEVQHICADYILRALVVPAGQHVIEFRFAPTSVKVGSVIAAISSALIILALVWYIAKTFVLNKEKSYEDAK